MTEVKDGAVCTCLRVDYDPIKHEDGSYTERWRCSACGSEFRRVQFVGGPKWEALRREHEDTAPHPDCRCRVCSLIFENRTLSAHYDNEHVLRIRDLERLRKAEAHLADIMAGCDIQKGDRLYRQVSVVLGDGRIQPEVECAALRAATELVSSTALESGQALMKERDELLIDIADRTEEADEALQKYYPDLELVANDEILAELKICLNALAFIDGMVTKAIGGADRLVRLRSEREDDGSP